MVTLIVSDIHLGSKHSHSVLVSALLEMSFDRLILNGDTINSLNFKKFKPIHWSVLGQLRDIARKRELVLIRGNHDVPYRLEGHTFGPQDLLAELIGVEQQEEVALEIKGKSYLVMHGDRFDPTLNWPIVTDIAAWCYRATTALHKKSAKWLRDRSKNFGGVVPLVKRGAVEYARERGHHGVIVGHTHFADDEIIDSIHYINGGSFMDEPCSFVLVDDQGARLTHWNENLQLAAASTPLVGRS
ncbi:MAG: UDP-2,3-diacylglucosamine diphosphatase [Gemmataceae bacterium]